MAKPLDLIGQRFGKLVVISRVENTKKGNTQWLCKCDCGKEKIALGYDLTHGRTVSCGCNPSGKPSSSRIDLVGKKFGRLTVEKLNKSEKGILFWDCICECGNSITVRGGNLKSGHTTSCGCNSEHTNKFIDITGQKFNRLTAIDYVGNQRWLCKCDCGKEKIVDAYALRHGKTKSCGCLHDEMARMNSFVEGCPHYKTHGASYTRLYREWLSMRNRCRPSYHGHNSYYDKGVVVCEEWKKFEVFQEWALKNGYSDELTLDRIDVNGNYEPNNCRWVDNITQQNNRSNNAYITIDGITKTLKQWADFYNLNYGMVKMRYQKGWSTERLFEPKHE